VSFHRRKIKFPMYIAEQLVYLYLSGRIILKCNLKI